MKSPSAMRGFAAVAALFAAAPLRGFGGIPLEKLPLDERRRLTSSYKRTKSTTFNRNGARECARRRRQMANGTHGY